MNSPLVPSEEETRVRRAAEERALAEAAERIDSVEMRLLPNTGDRYVHATVRLLSRDGRYRLKVVNPTREDATTIGDCCRVANSVHGGLSRLHLDLGFRIPGWYPVPQDLERSVYVVEEIEGGAPSLATAGGLADLVDRLVTFELATRSFDPPPLKPDWIDSCNREQYRNRLRSSLEGLYQREEINPRERDDVVARFDDHWTADPLDAGRCVSHGDFSQGNVRATDGELWLIDFEHAHVGAPVLDVAHLYVNLMFDDRMATARQLRQQYVGLRGARGLPPLPGVFPALLLERAAGKWNAMKAPKAERRTRIRALLLHPTE